MKKFMNMPLSSEITTFGNESQVRIRIPKETLAGWCLSLQLLKEKLVGSVVFRDRSAQMTLEIGVAVESQWCMANDPTRLEICFSPTDCDFVRHFYLQYYRDDFAAVDHVDIQDNAGGYITLYAGEYVSPVSSAEANRLLGMAD